MKRKILILSGILIVAVLSMTFFVRPSLTEQEKLILRNVEALAEAENADQGPKQKLVPTDERCVYVLDEGGRYIVVEGKWYTCLDDPNGSRNCRRECRKTN